MRQRGRLIVIVVALAFAVGGGLVALRAGELQSTPPSSGAGASASSPVDPVPWAGVAWRNVANPFAAGDPKPLRIDGLTVGDGVLVGWGVVATPGRNQFNEMGAIFVSADALHWRAIPIDHGVAKTDGSELIGVAVGPLGMLAFGGVCCGTEERAMWRSVDGLTWTRVALGGAFDRRTAWMHRIVGTTKGWVGVGEDGRQAAIWTSSDGATWDAVDPIAARLGVGTVSDVAVTATGVVAVGTVDDAAGTHDGAIWVSRDGVAWSRAAEADPSLIGPDDTELSQIVAFSGGLFVVGNFAQHAERVRCEQLTGALASLDERPPETAQSCGWGREHHWISPDASSWRRLLPFDPLPGQAAAPGARPIEFRLLAAGGPGLVNLAEDTVGPEGDARIWVSSDGITWQPLEPPSPAPAGTVHSALAVVGRQFFVIRDLGAADRGVVISVGAVP